MVSRLLNFQGSGELVYLGMIYCSDSLIQVVGVHSYQDDFGFEQLRENELMSYGFDGTNDGVPTKADEADIWKWAI